MLYIALPLSLLQAFIPRPDENMTSSPPLLRRRLLKDSQDNTRLLNSTSPQSDSLLHPDVKGTDKDK